LGEKTVSQAEGESNEQPVIQSDTADLGEETVSQVEGESNEQPVIQSDTANLGEKTVSQAEGESNEQPVIQSDTADLGEKTVSQAEGESNEQPVIQSDTADLGEKTVSQAEGESKQPVIQSDIYASDDVKIMQFAKINYAIIIVVNCWIHSGSNNLKKPFSMIKQLDVKINFVFFIKRRVIAFLILALLMLPHFIRVNFVTGKIYLFLACSPILPFW
jgi:hypothetical protein